MKQKPLRREPQQLRAQKRVDAILAAAAALIVEGGYEAASTTAIAERASIPIGTLYQFFPNKDAVLSALVMRYLDGLRQASANIFTPDAGYVPLPILIERTIDWLVAYTETHPGFHQVIDSAWISAELRQASDELFGLIYGEIVRMISVRAPALSQDRLHVAAKVMLHLIKGMLPLVEEADAHYRALIVADFKRIGTEYLQSVIQENPKSS